MHIRMPPPSGDGTAHAIAKSLQQQSIAKSVLMAQNDTSGSQSHHAPPSMKWSGNKEDGMLSIQQMLQRNSWGYEERRKYLNWKPHIREKDRFIWFMYRTYRVISLWGAIPTLFTFNNAYIVIACSIFVAQAYTDFFRETLSSSLNGNDSTQDVYGSIPYVIYATFGVSLFAAFVYGMPLLIDLIKGVKRRRNRYRFNKLMKIVLAEDTLASTYEYDYSSDNDADVGFQFFMDVEHCLLHNDTSSEEVYKEFESDDEDDDDTKSLKRAYFQAVDDEVSRQKSGCCRGRSVSAAGRSYARFNPKTS